MEELQLLPFPALGTDRLVLRRIVQEDVEEVYFMRSDARILEYLDREPCASLEEAAEWINMLEDCLVKNEGINWGICLKDDSKLLGTIGLWRFDKPNHRAEVGYILHPDHWGKGLVTEGLAEVMEQAWALGFHSLEANTNPDNRASAKVLQKLGFEREAYYRENWYFRGKFLDSAVYSCLNPYHQPGSLARK